VSNPKRPRWLIVMQEQHRALAEVFRERFEALGLVVILDRRRAERRRGGASRGVERRQADRRQRRPIAWVYSAQPSDVLGAAEGELDLSAGPIPALPSSGFVVKTCPDCGIAVEFEMPHFAQPPSRFETAVVHLTDPTFGVQHYVDVRAFTPTGRPMLNQRVQAQRQMPRR
jgi:hypothetical protein